MKKLLSSLKVLTFINLKIFTIIISLMTSIFIGIKYVKIIEDERNLMISNIKVNENEIIEDSKFTNKILRLDNKMLSKSLDKSIKYDSIDYDIRLIKKYSNKIIDDDSTMIQLRSIVNQKEIVLREISSFHVNRVKLKDVSTQRKISIVSVMTKKGIFKTITKIYTDVNKYLYFKEYSKNILVNSKRLNKLIRHNNDLSLQMKVIIDNYSNKKIINSYKDNENIFNKLKKNIKLYTTISLILLSLIIILVYLLLVDIKKIKKANSRSNEAVTMLITTAKELRNENKK